jgi:hypothetical protein
MGIMHISHDRSIALEIKENDHPGTKVTGITKKIMTRDRAARRLLSWCPSVYWWSEINLSVAWEPMSMGAKRGLAAASPSANRRCAGR